MDKQCKEKTLQKRCEMIYLMCSFERTVYSFIFLDSSMVEHSAVNRVVVGSSPTRGVYFINE